MTSDSTSQFLCTSYVGEQRAGPLSITAVDEGTLRVVAVLYDTERVRRSLENGAPLDEVVATLKKIQHTDVTIPLEHLAKIVWNDFSTDVVITFQDEKKTKRATTYIASDDERTRLLLAVRESMTGEVHCFDEPASVMAVAWTRFLGAAFAITGTLVFVLMWDPARIGRVRGGAIALMLGKTGCAIVGIGIFCACCISAWWAIRKRSRYFTCEFGDRP